MRALFFAVMIMVSSVAADACELGAESAEGIPSLPGCPAEVKDYWSRFVGCEHFGGEPTGDPTPAVTSRSVPREAS